MSDFRLDYIGKFKDGTVEQMKEMRQRFIDLEDEIDRVAETIDDNRLSLGCPNFLGIIRVYHECKTHIEQAQMYAIKLLCLMGEEKDETR